MAALARIFMAIIVLGAVYFGWFAVKHSPSPIATSTSLAATTSAPTITYKNTSEDTIFVTSPKPGSNQTSTIIVKGFARGTWYFEAVFPIEVINKDGLTIGRGQGRATSEWMTEKFVPFTAQIALKPPYSGPALIVLKKDNPSGDPARDASLTIPINLQ